ncbi:unnamed protein product [Rotaria sp. Silwood1]|nr:unnamed protein product [Rotaria sp. Silwood1]
MQNYRAIKKLYGLRSTIVHGAATGVNLYTACEDLQNKAITNLGDKVVIFHGDDDEDVPLTSSQKYKSDNTTLKIIKGVGHGFGVEDDEDLDFPETKEIHKGTGVFVHPNVKIGKNVRIGHCSCVGYGDPADGDIIIEDDVIIGAFCVIHFGATLKQGVELDHYCKVGIEAKIGKHTKILYGKHIYDEASIGANCIIGGHVADRTIIEDNVTYMGEIAHSHRDASLNWDTTVEGSPVIYKGSVVGVNALIIGPRKIGPCAYVGAGEIVRTDVGEGMFLSKDANE